MFSLIFLWAGSLSSVHASHLEGVTLKSGTLGFQIKALAKRLDMGHFSPIMAGQNVSLAWQGETQNCESFTFDVGALYATCQTDSQFFAIDLKKERVESYKP